MRLFLGLRRKASDFCSLSSTLSLGMFQGCYDKMIGWFTGNSTYILAASGAIVAVEVCKILLYSGLLTSGKSSSMVFIYFFSNELISISLVYLFVSNFEGFFFMKYPCPA